MRNAERLFVYGGLAMALAVAAGARLHTPATAANEPPAAALKIATVDMIDIALKMFASASNANARQPIIDKQRAMEFELQSMQQSLQGMQQAKQEGTAEFQTKLKFYQEKGQEFQKLQAQYDAMQIKQVSDAYTATVNAADTIATRMGYTMVLSSKSARSPFVAPNMQAVIQDFLVRPVVKQGPGDDITEAVIKELNIEPPPAATAPTGPGASTPPAAGQPAPIPAAKPVNPNTGTTTPPAPK